MTVIQNITINRYNYAQQINYFFFYFTIKHLQENNKWFIQKKNCLNILLKLSSLNIIINLKKEQKIVF